MQVILLSSIAENVHIGIVLYSVQFQYKFWTRWKLLYSSFNNIARCIIQSCWALKEGSSFRWGAKQKQSSPSLKVPTTLQRPPTDPQLWSYWWWGCPCGWRWPAPRRCGPLPRRGRSGCSLGSGGRTLCRTHWSSPPGSGRGAGSPPPGSRPRAWDLQGPSAASDRWTWCWWRATRPNLRAVGQVG